MQKLYFADPQGALSIAVAVVLAGRQTFTMSAKKGPKFGWSELF